MFNRMGIGGLFWPLVGRPGLWGEAIRAVASVRRRGRLGPSSAYLSWRSHTAYGETMAFPSGDFIDFLEWRRRMRGLQ